MELNELETGKMELGLLAKFESLVKKYDKLTRREAISSLVSQEMKNNAQQKLISFYETLNKNR